SNIYQTSRLLYDFFVLYPAASQKVQLEPLNSTALRDSDVQFIATIQGHWEVTNWGVRGIQVLTIINSTNSIIPSEDRFSARFCVNTSRSCVEFTVHNVTRADAGEVVCNVQVLQSKTVFAFFLSESGTVSIPGGNVTVKQGGEVELECVTTAWFPAPTISWTQNGQAVNSSLYNTTSTNLTRCKNRALLLLLLKNKTFCGTLTYLIPLPATVPKPPDWTVLIAIVVSFGSCGLLVFLILGIVICYKHRKEKSKRLSFLAQLLSLCMAHRCNPKTHSQKINVKKCSLLSLTNPVTCCFMLLSRTKLPR
uniref:Immunoglobulin superfamily, member 5a n=1 Tax=Poecilia reticulata TaxID=8081 RepID=A0A3P9P0F6_POERE